MGVRALLPGPDNQGTSGAYKEGVYVQVFNLGAVPVPGAGYFAEAAEDAAEMAVITIGWKEDGGSAYPLFYGDGATETAALDAEHLHHHLFLLCFSAPLETFIPPSRLIIEYHEKIYPHLHHRSAPPCCSPLHGRLRNRRPGRWNLRNRDRQLSNLCSL